MPAKMSKHAGVYLMVEEILQQQMTQIVVVVEHFLNSSNKKRKRSSTPKSYRMIERIPTQIKHLSRLVGFSDADCIVNLRMDRNTFGRLCLLLRHVGGLHNGKYVSVEEQVAMFVGILAHHKKNKIVRFDYWRSGQTISHYVHHVLNAILKLHRLLLVKPQPVDESCTDHRWKWFKGCLGALDGTYVNVQVPLLDKPRYRTRKGQISTNVLAVCDRYSKFVYVLPGWEGSAADSRILRDAINRPNGLRVPKGEYYLCDNGYANSEGFLTPFKGVRYHLKEWGPTAEQPRNAKEMFNLRHTKARNVVERAFDIMKMRWGIFRCTTYYPIKVQTRLIMACFLLHNFIRSEMAVDPVEVLFDNIDNDREESDDDMPYIDNIESSDEWNNKRDELAELMWAGRIV